MLKIFSFGLSTLVVLLTTLMTMQLDLMLERNPGTNYNIGYELAVPMGLVCAINFSIFIWVRKKETKTHQWLFLASASVPLLCVLFLQFIAPQIV